MTREIHVRIRRLVVPASIGGDRDVLMRDVIEAIERHVAHDVPASRDALDGDERSIGARIGETVATSIRTAMPRSSRSHP